MDDASKKIRDRMCYRKRRYASREDAEKSILSEENCIVPLRAYECPYCGNWHRTKVAGELLPSEVLIANKWSEISDPIYKMSEAIESMGHDVSEGLPLCVVGCRRCALDNAWITVSRIIKDDVMAVNSKQ